jgi:hypothetical protein
LLPEWVEVPSDMAVFGARAGDVAAIVEVQVGLGLPALGRWKETPLQEAEVPEFMLARVLVFCDRRKPHAFCSRAFACHDPLLTSSGTVDPG